MESEETVLFFTPSLAALLQRFEREAGRPLIEVEVLQIRDQAVCIAIPPKSLPAMTEERGYEDIDPHRCWEQWQEARITLHVHTMMGENDHRRMKGVASDRAPDPKTATARPAVMARKTAQRRCRKKVRRLGSTP